MRNSLVLLTFLFSPPGCERQAGAVGDEIKLAALVSTQPGENVEDEHTLMSRTRFVVADSPQRVPAELSSRISQIGILLNTEHGGDQCLEFPSCDASKVKRNPACTKKGRFGLCSEGAATALQFSASPSLAEESCTVTAVGARHVMTAPHCVPLDYLCSGPKQQVEEDREPGDPENSPSECWGGSVPKLRVLFPNRDGESSNGAYYDAFYVAMDQEVVLFSEDYCTLAGEKREDPKGVDEECAFHTSAAADPGAEGIVLLPLDREHGRGAAIECSTTEALETWAFGFPGAGELIGSVASAPSFVRNRAEVRGFLESGNSGSALWDQTGKLVGVEYALAGRWELCGPGCRDSLRCVEPPGSCWRAFATTPSRGLCACLRSGLKRCV